VIFTDNSLSLPLLHTRMCIVLPDGYWEFTVSLNMEAMDLEESQSNKDVVTGVLISP
jgi:hypothetical protein